MATFLLPTCLCACSMLILVALCWHSYPWLALLQLH